MAPKKKGGGGAANMTPEQIAAKRAAAMAMYGGGAAAKPAAPAPKAPAAAEKPADAAPEDAMEKLAVDVSEPSKEESNWVTDGGEDCRKDAIAYAKSTLSDAAASGEFATALPTSWQRLVTIEPTPAMLKAAKKQGTSEAAPNGCKILTDAKGIAYLLDAEGKASHPENWPGTAWRTQLKGANIGTSAKPMVRDAKGKIKTIMGKDHIMRDAIQGQCEVTLDCLPTGHIAVSGSDEGAEEAMALIDDLVDADGAVAAEKLAERLVVADPFGGVIEVPVAEEWVGAIIGKGGVGLKRISDETGCAIDYEEPEQDEKGEPIEGGRPGFFRIKAKWEDKCTLAQRRIEERLTLLQRLDVVSVVMVPKQCVGRLIGRGGTNIKALQRESGANRLSFDKEGGNRGHTQGCTIQTSDVKDAITAGMTVLEAVPADSGEARADLKARQEDYAGQLGALGGTADVDATKEQVQAAWEKKYPKRTHEEIAAEANKNNPIELSAIDFDLWVLQYACDSRVVATGKARDEVK
jgi:predicted RNA-binding protein YlqC (UPF0109 family)